MTDTLAQVAGGGYRYFDRRALAQESYNGSGALTGIQWIDGRSITLSTSGTSTVVSDNFGRTATLNFTAAATWTCSGGGYTAAGTYASPAAACAAWSSQLGGSGCTPINGVSFSCNAGGQFSVTAHQDGATRNKLTSITDAAGQTIALSSDPATGNLSGITWQDGKTRTFLYENSSAGALTGITDELTQRYATFGYDSSWRAISSEHAGAVDRYSVTYTAAPHIAITEAYDSNANATFRYYDWAIPQGTVVTDPLGTQSNWTAGSLLTKNYLTGQSQPAGSGCAASSSALSYDANGNVASADDFNGNRVCSVYDLGRNLETTRVEGLANTQVCSTVMGSGAALQTGSRKTSTLWHPDWRLEAKRAEAGKLTTSIYNGQPDPFNGNALASCAPSTALLPDGKPIAVLCKQVEQATSDANGSQGFSASLQSGMASRARRWTYNSHGQVLTERDSHNNLTTYTHYTDTTADHTLGDLQSVTSAKNQTTTHTKYNKHGQLLQSVDPNGITTTHTYDLRQRLLSTRVGGQTTSYEYDAAGQLLKVIQPDTSWIGFEYDAAHRQVAVKDSLGNRIEHVLDNAGNKTGQSVKDPGGSLARSLSQSIDALGRVQQMAGRP